MEVTNPAAAPAPTGGDWRSQLLPGAREVMVKVIMKSLKKYIPMTDQEGLNRLRNLAEKYEQRFCKEATSQSSYSRKIAMLLLYVEPPNENPHHPAQELELLLLQLFQQSPERVLGQQRHLQLSVHQQPNLKKRKLDCSSSWAAMPILSAPVDDHCSSPVPSFPEIPEGGPQYTTLGEPAAVPRMGGIDG